MKVFNVMMGLVMSLSFFIGCSEGFKSAKKDINSENVVQEGREADGEGNTPISEDQKVLSNYLTEMTGQSQANRDDLGQEILGVSVEFIANNASGENMTATVQMYLGEEGGCETLSQATSYQMSKSGINMSQLLNKEALVLGAQDSSSRHQVDYEARFQCTLVVSNQCDEAVLTIKRNTTSKQATVHFGLVKGQQGFNGVYSYTNDRDVDLEGFYKAQSYDLIAQNVVSCQASGSGSVSDPTGGFNEEDFMDPNAVGVR